MNIAPVTLTLPHGVARLEPLGLHHAQGLHEASVDPAIWAWLPFAQPKTPADMQKSIERALTAQAKATELPFAVIDTRTGQVAGTTRYLDIQPENRGLEIGATWYGVAWQRTRVNTECKLMLLTHAFDHLGAVRVQLRTDARNQRSRDAILRIGAQYEGRLRQSRILHDGFIRDTVYFSIIADEWPAVRAGLLAKLAR